MELLYKRGPQYEDVVERPEIDLLHWYCVKQSTSFLIDTLGLFCA